MILVHMLARFKSILLSLLAVFRRALCCISRRRKPSFSDCEVLTSVNVVQSNNNHSSRHRDEAQRDWNSWDDSPRTVTEHIEQYRQKLVQPKVDQNNEASVDFFQDMAPKVKKQKKVFIDTNKNAPEGFSRLQASDAPHIPRLQGAELEDWSDDNQEHDDGTGGWDNDQVTDEMTKELIREKRREARALRNQRQQQKLQQHHTQRGLSAHH